MLVLSRKQNEKILFPHLGIEIDVRRIAGSSVTIGINAPKSIFVLRGELANDAEAKGIAGWSDERESKFRHAVRNQLNKATLAVAIAQKQLDKGNKHDSEKILRELLLRLTHIDEKVVDTSSSLFRLCSTSSSGQTRRALVVEDDANERALMVGYLELCGFTTHQASDGVEALAFLTENSVDLVVLDMRMPRMGGMETVAEIRSRSSLSDTRIVVVSGEAVVESVVTGEDQGISQWFSKPLDAIRFSKYLESVIN